MLVILYIERVLRDMVFAVSHEKSVFVNSKGPGELTLNEQNKKTRR
jgi:hypothetical protein